MTVANKRSAMTLYSGSDDIDSHRVRIVLAEKGIPVDIIEIDREEDIEDLYHINPYNTVPTLTDRNLVLYHAPIIIEYLDERFPHPPLLPVYPIARAESRLMIYRIEHDWYEKFHTIKKGGAERKIEKARKELEESLLAIADVFADSPYFLSQEFSLIDCTIAPILWRLEDMGIKLGPKTAKPILDYANRIFERASFQESLTETEQELHLDIEY